MKLAICTKFQVNQMNCVESRRGGPIDPPLKASCNYFFLKASRVKYVSYVLPHDVLSVYALHGSKETS